MHDRVALSQSFHCLDQWGVGQFRGIRTKATRQADLSRFPEKKRGGSLAPMFVEGGGTEAAWRKLCQLLPVRLPGLLDRQIE